jgi:hypothetical protein
MRKRLMVVGAILVAVTSLGFVAKADSHYRIRGKLHPCRYVSLQPWDRLGSLRYPGEGRPLSPRPPGCSQLGGLVLRVPLRCSRHPCAGGFERFPSG